MFFRRGFTLIELLVVIAIIAVVVSLLLPALGKAKKAGWLAVSLSNIRQITAAAVTYREDNKAFMPLTLTYTRGSDKSAAYPFACGWCTWQYGGKNADGPRWSGSCFDVEAADRPLNPYLYPDILFEAPDAPASLPSADPSRKTVEMLVFRDPADRYSYQHSASFSVNPVGDPISSYNDVGTSYHFNVKWWDQVAVSLSFERAFKFGCERLRLSDAFTPSRMVWINDQFSDVVANNVNASFKLVNGYGDTNKSVMGFMDGHAAYHKVQPGNLPTSYKNELYTFVFEDLRIPGQ